MNIVILSGGSGNDAIVKGLINNGYLDNISIITNLYDNGKSTGVCRAVTDTLGVSDVRKNHFRAYKTFNKDYVDPDINCLYSNRYDMGDNPKEFCINELSRLNFPDLIEYAERYFDNPSSMNYKYNDFSIINIVYAQMYKELGYEKTNKYFTELLGLNDFVVCNSFDNVYIYANSKSNVTIGGEEDIVEYKNKFDPIVSINYLNKHGDQVEPTINKKAIDLINDSDIIIISTGTFWSSLYPTLEYGDFYKYINASNAKKIWIMNTEEDKDAYGVSSNMFITHLDNLGLNLNDFIIVENIDAKESLREFNNNYNIIYKYLGNISGKNDSKLVYDTLAQLM